MFQALWHFVASQELMLALCCFTPTLAFLSINIKEFTNKQIASSLALLLGLGILISVAFFAGKQAFGEGNTLFLSLSVAEVIGCSLAYVLFVFFNEPLFKDFLLTPRKRMLALVALALLVFGGTALLSTFVINALLAAYAILSVVDFKKNYVKERNTLLKSREEILANDKCDPQVLQDCVIRFRRKPNVWLLFLEAINSFKAVEDFYGLDCQETRAFLQEHGFTEYWPHYSNTTFTWGSAVVMLSRLPKWEEELTPYPYVLKVFKENDYKIHVFDDGAGTFGRWAGILDYATFTMKGIRKWVFYQFLPLFAQSTPLRLLFNVFDPFDSSIHLPATYRRVRDAVRQYGGKKRDGYNSFNIVRIGAHHTPVLSKWADNSKTWPQHYRTIYTRALEQIRETLSIILEQDPGALVVVASDHGAHFHGSDWFRHRGDLNQKIREMGLNTADLCKDHFDVLCAIRWPEEKPSGHPLTHVNLFAHVFSWMANDGTPPQLQMDISELVTPTGVHIMAHGTRAKKIITPYDFDTMMNGLRLATRIEPWNTAISRELGKMVIRYSEPDGLDALAQRHLHSDEPVNATTTDETQKYDLACLWALRGKTDESEKLCMDLLKLPDAIRIKALWLLCLLLNERNEYVKALKYATQLLGLVMRRGSRAPMEPGEADVARMLTMFLVRLGQWQDARDMLARRENIGAWDFILRALCEQKLGNPDAGLKILVQGAEEYKKHPTAHRCLCLRIGLMALQHKWMGRDIEKYRKMAQEEMANAKDALEHTALFDRSYYREQMSDDALDVTQPLIHFLCEGVYCGLNPSSAFNSIFYLVRNADVYLLGKNPLLDFMEYGQYVPLLASLATRLDYQYASLGKNELE